MAVVVNLPVTVILTPEPMPNRYNFALVNGDSRTLTVTVRDSTRTVVDLTGCTISFAIASTANQAAFTTLSIGSGITVSSPSTGVFVVTLSPSNTAALSGTPPLHPWAYQCTITDASGNVTTALVGEIAVRRAIS